MKNAFLKKKTQELVKLLLLTIFISYVIFYYVFTTYPLSCSYSLGYLIITLIYISSFFSKQMLKRSCTKNCYLQENTLLAKIVISPLIPAISSVLLALIYTLSLVYLVASLKLSLILLSLIYLPLATWIYLKIKSLSQNQVSPKAQNIFTKNIFVFILTLLVLIATTIYNIFYGHEPYFLTNNLQTTISLAANSMSSNCGLINFLLQIKAEISGYYWFVIKSSSNQLQAFELKAIIWLIFLTINTLSIIALNRLIAELLCFTAKIINRGKNAA